MLSVNTGGFCPSLCQGGSILPRRKRGGFILGEVMSRGVRSYFLIIDAGHAVAMEARHRRCRVICYFVSLSIQSFYRLNLISVEVKFTVLNEEISNGGNSTPLCAIHLLERWKLGLRLRL